MLAVGTLAAAAALGGWMAYAYNRLVRARNLVREAWSGIDVQLRRRRDLVPGLVDVVRAYGRHERDAFAEVVALRAGEPPAGAGPRGPAETALSRALRQLLAVAEAYPELRASEQFLALQARLAEIVTTAPLGVREGLTIVVAWPKGHVTPPTVAERLRAFVDDNWTAAAGASGLILLLLSYLWAWLRVGRDPAGGVVIPRFVPPGGLSPAAVRYVWRMGFDDRTLAAAFLSLAVKGWLTVAGDPKEPGGFRLVRRAGGKPGVISAAESATATALFAGGDTVALRPASHARVSRARKVLRDQLAREYGVLYFRTNRRWIIPGVAVSILTVLAAAAGEGMASGGAGMVILVVSAWLTGWTFATAMLWASHAWVPAVIFTAFGLVGAGTLFAAGPPGALVLLAVLAATNVLFYYLLRAPTRAGRGLLDEIEGLRMYLTVAERDRLNALHPPEETPATFERFLPYAFALDVEQAWAERFAAVLGTTDGQPGYAPAWYGGRPLGGSSGTRLSSSLAGLAPAVAAAAHPPGSSSGRSGGGGGGGSSGGGGGGW